MSTYRMVIAQRSPNKRTRDRATEQLVKVGLDAVPALIEELSHTNGREGSIHTLARIGEPAIPLLLRRLRKIPDTTGLMRVKPGGSSPELAALLKMPLPTLRAALDRESESLRSLFLCHIVADPARTFTDKSVVDSVAGMSASLLDSGDASVRTAARDALAVIVRDGTQDASVTAFRTLSKRLQAADVGARIEMAIELCTVESAVLSVTLIPPPIAEEFVRSTIVEAITDCKDVETRRKSAQVLPHVKLSWNVASITELIKLVEVDDPPEVRAYAAHIISGLDADAKSAVPTIIHLLDSPEDDVRKAAAAALNKMGLSEPGVIDALLGAAGDSEAGTCATIINIFRQAALADPSVLDRLTRAITDNRKLSAESKGRLRTYCVAIKQGRVPRTKAP
jgi:hypothetical protein